METYHNDVFGFSFGTYRRRRGYVPLRCLGDVPARRLWVFHLKTCLRRREDILMRRCCYILLRCRHDVPIRCHGGVPLRPLNDVPSRRSWVFHLRRTCDVAGTYRETLLRHSHDVLLPGGLSSRQRWLERHRLMQNQTAKVLKRHAHVKHESHWPKHFLDFQNMKK